MNSKFTKEDIQKDIDDTQKEIRLIQNRLDFDTARARQAISERTEFIEKLQKLLIDLGETS